MVKILRIEYIRTMVCIILEDHEEFWLRKKDFAALRWSEGMEMDREQFIQSVHLCQYPCALNKAVEMLARRPCSKEEIRKKLQFSRFSEEVTDLVIYKLEKEKLVNDHAFADQWVRYRSEGKYGPGRIVQELRYKGISEETVQSALQQMDPDDQLENAVVLAEKSLKRKNAETDIRKQKQKVTASLVRKGYDWETARKACELALNRMK